MTQKQNSIKNSITIKLVEGTSKKLNETDNAVYNCYLDTIPFISAGIDIALKDNAKLDTIFGLIENFNVEYDKEIQLISDLKTNAFPEGVNGLNFLKVIFSNSVEEVAIQLANKNNIKTESAKKILEIASFILLHYLKSNEVTKDSFKNYFLNNKNSPVLQDENIKTEEHLNEKIILEIPIEEYVKDKGNTKKKFLVFAFILMVVMAIVYFTIFNPTQQVKLNDPTIVESKNTVGPSQSIEQADIRTLGEFIEFSLPDNILHIPSKGVEKAMLDYILDSDNALDTGGFTLEFDRVSFLNRENNFDQSSTEQIRNIAEILNSFPKVKILIASYTDNQGVAKDNLKLSKLRAESTRAALLKLGVSGNRILTEGFGQEFPLNTNQNPEEQKLNRRTTFKITEK